MKNTKDRILEALQKIGEEKASKVKSLEELTELLKAEGADVTADEVQKTLEELANSAGKTEISKEVLDTVAGGWDWKYLIPGYGGYRIIKDLLGGGDKPGGKTENGGGKGGASGSWGDDDPAGGNPGGGNAGGGNNQNNSGNSGIQQNNQNGDNNNSGGMSQNF